MKRFATVVAIAAFSGSAALANGITMVPPDPVPYTPPAPAFSWGGLYGGASLGYGSTNYNPTLDINVGMINLGLQMPDLGGRGALGGLQLGYNFMLSDNMVAGIQLDGVMTGINNTTAFNVGVGPFGVNAEYNLAPRSMITLAGRLGFLPTPDTMVYGLLGYTHANYRGALNVSVTPVPGTIVDESYTFNRNGVAVGLGIETRIGSNTTLGLEYRYNHMQRYSFIEGPPVDLGFDPSVQTVRAVLNYHF